MAESVTITEDLEGPIKRLTFAWACASDGTATGATGGTYSGKIVGLATVPSTGGTQPDDNYDVVINDDNSVDVLFGAGDSRDETNAEYVLEASLGSVVNSILTLEISGAGVVDNAGTVYLYFK